MPLLSEGTRYMIDTLASRINLVDLVDRPHHRLTTVLDKLLAL